MRDCCSTRPSKGHQATTRRSWTGIQGPVWGSPGVRNQSFKLNLGFDFFRPKWNDATIFVRERYSGDGKVFFCLWTLICVNIFIFKAFATDCSLFPSAWLIMNLPRIGAAESGLHSVLLAIRCSPSSITSQHIDRYKLIPSVDNYMEALLHMIWFLQFLNLFHNHLLTV